VSQDVSVGVDVGGTSTRIMVFDAAGTELGATRSQTPRGGDALVEHLADGIAAAFPAHGDRLVGVGVGIPGGVHDGVVSMALNIGIEQPLPIARLLAARLGVPVSVENDVNAAAFGAFVERAGERASSLAYLSIGTGFAAGLVIDGEIVRGAFGAAGEIGHIRVPSGGSVRCVCGQQGCVEAVLSGRALIERMQSAGLEGRAEQLWQAADAGIAAAVTIRDDAVSALAWCCQTVTLLLDVETIVVGGGVGLKLNDRLITRVRGELNEDAERSGLLAASRVADRVIASPAGVEVGARGADQLARRARAAQSDGVVA